MIIDETTFLTARKTHSIALKNLKSSFNKLESEKNVKQMCRNTRRWNKLCGVDGNVKIEIWDVAKTKNKKSSNLIELSNCFLFCGWEWNFQSLIKQNERFHEQVNRWFSENHLIVCIMTNVMGESIKLIKQRAIIEKPQLILDYFSRQFTAITMLLHDFCCKKRMSAALFLFFCSFFFNCNVQAFNH